MKRAVLKIESWRCSMRHRLRATFPLILGFLILSIPLSAHHGAAEFDLGKRLTLKGTVTEWFWANPHCFLRFDVKKDDAGQVAHWVVEAQSGPNIIPYGFTKQTFKVGDEVTVTLEPVKNGRPLGRMLEVVLPSGKTLGFGGSNGAGAGSAGGSKSGDYPKQ
jgi:hypothetical protein